MALGDSDMTERAVDSEIPLTAEQWRSLLHLSHLAALKAAELENTRLQQQIAVRDVVESLNVRGRRVRIDLDAGVVRIDDIVDRDVEAP